MNHRLVKQWRMPGWISIAWNVLLLAAAAVVGVLAKVDDELDAKTWKWVHDPKTQLWLTCTLAAVVAVDSIRRIVSRVGSEQEEQYRAEIRKQLSTAIAVVSDESGVKAGELGCGLFLVHRSRRHGDRLIRIERVRLLDNIGESGVTFAPGVGTVGACWQSRREQHFDWIAINTRYHNDLPTLQDWQGTRTTTKHGFDYESWKIMVGRYAEVLAVPVTVKNELVGVLAVDRKWHEDDPSASAQLNKRQIKTSLGGIARFLEPVLASSR